MKQVITGVISFLAGLTIGAGLIVSLFTWEV